VASPAARLLRIASVAALLDVSERTVRRLWASDPDFPGPRLVGKTHLWLADEVSFYVELVRRRPPKRERNGG